jgi:hypothetical protein
MTGRGFVKALLCRVPYRFVMALLGIEMALTRSGEAGISGARAMNSDEGPWLCEDM